MHDIARIDHAHAHAAVARRDDVGVIEMGLSGFDRGRVGVDRSFGLIDFRLLLIDVLLGFEVLED